jgi:hypothetical protein
MNNIAPLTLWQKRQAVLLYKFSSLDYLKEMQLALNELIAYVDKLLDLAKKQGRDKVLVSYEWGNRNTSENWANNAWPFLKDFQLTTARQIAERNNHKYSITGFNQFHRGISEFSTNWASTEEEANIEKYIKRISIFCKYIDLTLDKFSTSSRWNDFTLYKAWLHFENHYFKLPRIKIREDIMADTNTVPPKSGVYFSSTDSNAAPQFSWAAGPHGKVLPGRTFNQLGMAALDYTGRDGLWSDGEKMLQFVMLNKNNTLLKEDAFYSDSKTPVLAPSLVARNAFATCNGKWIHVELVDGEYEDDEGPNDHQSANLVKLSGGEICKIPGYYFTPARANLRQLFNIGEVLPNFESDYGVTIWQWDANQ